MGESPVGPDVEAVVANALVYLSRILGQRLHCTEPPGRVSCERPWRKCLARALWLAGACAYC